MSTLKKMIQLSNSVTKQHWTVIQGIKGIGLKPEDLHEAGLAYFQWCDDNPIQKPELLRAGEKAGTMVYAALPRPYTLSGLCLHCKITPEYLLDVARSETQNDFFFVANQLLAIIRTQNIEYALVGVFNPMIAGKLAGVDTNTKPAAGSPNITIQVDGSAPKLLNSEADVETITTIQVIKD